MNGHGRLFRRKRTENILLHWKNCKGNMRKQYSLELSSAAERDMRRLPRSVQEEIAFTKNVRKNVMPTISMFYGILIRMFFRDVERHHVPHIHAEYQGEVAVYSINDGTLLAGNIPLRKHKLVVAWIEIHQEDLLADWELAANGKKPFPIRGLDQ